MCGEYNKVYLLAKVRKSEGFEPSLSSVFRGVPSKKLLFFCLGRLCLTETAQAAGGMCSDVGAYARVGFCKVNVANGVHESEKLVKNGGGPWPVGLRRATFAV